MNTAKLLALTVITLASVSLMAQQVNATAQQNASSSAAGMHANESTHAAANANVRRGHAQANGAAASSTAMQGRHGRADANANGSAASYAAMRPVKGRLAHKLDSKSAKVGEPVVLKTTQKTKTADGMVIPKGSRLLGQVTEVQAHAHGHQQSSLGIVFNRVELKHGQSFAVRSMIEQVQPSAAALEAKAMENENAFAEPPGPPAGTRMGGGGQMMGGGHVGGGLIGGGAGVVGGATSAVGGAVGPVGSGVNSAAGGALNAGRGAIHTTGNLAGNAAAGMRHGVDGSAGAAGALGTHATAIPGVMLNSNAAGGASGTLTAAKRNVHLDSGTQMVVGVAAAR